MSHRATVRLPLLDPEALAATCARLRLETRQGQVQFYDKSSAAGTVVQLPGWQYGVVVDARGQLHYDHYEGQWGDPAHLGRFLQTYTEEAATRWAQREGYPVIPAPAPDGWVRLEISG